MTTTETDQLFIVKPDGVNPLKIAQSLIAAAAGAVKENGEYVHDQINGSGPYGDVLRSLRDAWEQLGVLVEAGA